MENLSDTITGDIIEQHLDQGGQLTGTELGRKVEEEVREKTDMLRGEFGDAVTELVEEEMETAESYRESIEQRVGGYTLGDTESSGAAGWNDKGNGNEVVISETAAKLEMSSSEDKYWKRVATHEGQHEMEQTFAMNQQDISYVDASGHLKEATAIGDLTERDAIRAADQPDSDLTSEYQKHAEIGDEVVSIVGEEAVHTALKTGDVRTLQQTILETQHDKVLALMRQDKSAEFAQAA